MDWFRSKGMNKINSCGIVDLWANFTQVGNVAPAAAILVVLTVEKKGREGKADYPSRPLPCRRPCRFLLWRPAQDPNFFYRESKKTIHPAIIICRENIVSVRWLRTKKSCLVSFSSLKLCVCVCPVCLSLPSEGSIDFRCMCVWECESPVRVCSRRRLPLTVWCFLGTILSLKLSVGL